MLHLSESTRCDHIIHPLYGEAPAQLDCLNVTFSSAGEGGEEEGHAQGIIDITEGINERRIPVKINASLISNGSVFNAYKKL